jgi:hypothetical protein
VDHDIMWVPWEGPGLEHLHLTLPPGGAIADGVIIGISEGRPFRVRYEIHYDARWRAREVRVTLLGSDQPAIGLHADGDGQWTADTGEPRLDLDGCLDIDLSATPFTNTLPIRRLRLQPGASAELLVAYLDVPELKLEATRQRYTRLEARPDGARYRFEALPSGFTAELPVDADGLVIDYPQLFRRVWSE